MEWVGTPYKKEFSEGYKYTTNNRMELLAVIVALKKLKIPNVNVTVFTDSKYVSDAVQKGGFLNGNEPISLERKIVTFGFPSLKNIENIE